LLAISQVIARGISRFFVFEPFNWSTLSHLPPPPPSLPPSLSSKPLVQHFIIPTFWNPGIDSDDWQEEEEAVTEEEEGGEDKLAPPMKVGGARGRGGRGGIPENEEEEGVSESADSASGAWDDHVSVDSGESTSFEDSIDRVTSKSRRSSVYSG
jgi:hypothetical protein